jgi:2-polyprenyl-6-methoxyphenol hydroxylase-like FAD-dependent oxidoreductase
VECSPQTWAALGLDRLGPDESTVVLQQIFARHLNGKPLINRRAGTGGAGWLSFRRVTNERWHCGNLVLMGDAAHTTHFAIGSGTKLAMQDAIALAEGLAAGDRLPTVLQAYEHRRKAALEPLQRAARASSEWFENVPDPDGQGATEFAYSLSDRRGEYPMWRYLLHVATQRVVLRSLLRRLLSVRRWSRGRRRLLSARSRPATAGRRSVAQPQRTAVREVRPTGRE